MRNCDLDFKLEDILPKFRPDLQNKIRHSVDLICKAEKLALAYDPEDAFFLAFSGGKDSQCLYRVAKLANVRFKSHMNMTSIDPPEVIRFIRAEYPDVVLHRPKDSIFNLAVKKGILPSLRVRWCCAEYKETAGAGKVTLIGIRHTESNRRAKRKEVEVSNHGYSGDLEGLAEYRKKRNSGRKPRKGTFSIINVNGESEVGCIHGKESLLISPIIDWTASDVWTFLNTLGIKHCVLYDQGFTRIGCILCPMSKVSQKRQDEKQWPHVKRGWIRAIKKIRGGGGSPKATFGGTFQAASYPSDQSEGGSDWKPRGEMSSKCFLPKQMLATDKLFSPPRESRGNASPKFSIPKQWMQDDENFLPHKSDVQDSKQFLPRNTREPEPKRLTNQQKVDCQSKRLAQSSTRRAIGFSGGSSSDGLTDEQENEIAENIYDWWTSGKSYRKWYTDKFCSPTLFDDDDKGENTSFF